MTEGFRDDSGLVGIAGHPRAVPLAIAGLGALPHRGDRAGIASSDGYAVRAVRADHAEALARASLQGLGGGLAIARVGRSTAADADGPFVARVRGGWVGIALSGRLANGTRIANELDERGVVRTTSTDAETIAHLLGQSSQRTAMNRLVDALWKVDGGFALLVITEDRLVAVRDPRGFRPLVLGRVDGAAMFASEDGALRAAGADVLRDVEPGEMIIVDPGGVRSVAPFARRKRATCAQEVVSIARPDGRVAGTPIHDVREKLGERLAVDAPCTADIVVASTEASLGAAVGFARASALPWFPALLRGDPGEGERRTLTAVPSVVAERRVALVAAALTTGEGLRRSIHVLRGAGAVEVHVRVASPQVQSGCPYGVSGPTADELAHGDSAAIASRIGADSVAQLALGAFRDVLASTGTSFCDGCTSGEWPLAPDSDGQLALFKS